MTSASSTIPQFLDELRLAKRSPNTVRTYQQGLRLFARIVGKNDELDEKNFIKFLQKTSILKASSHATYRAAVSRLYQYHSPGVPVKLLSERYGQKIGRRIPVYKEEAIEELVAYAEKLSGDLLALRDRAFIITLADTGLRISEACSMLRGDIDFEKARAVIIGKGDKQAAVLFSARSLEAIRRYLSARAELDGKSGKPLGSLPLFARHDPGAGKKIKKLSSKGAWAAFAERMKEAGIEKGSISPHKLRHYFVTRILEATGGDIAQAKELARHEDINTTSRYGHTARGKLERTYNEVFNK